MCNDNQPLPIPTTILHAAARLPTQAHLDDAGHDLYSTTSFILWPGVPYTVPTGIAIQLPEGYHAKIEGRSGLARRGIVPHGGVIDQGYTGEVCVLLCNHGWLPRRFRQGDRVAQLVVRETVPAGCVGTYKAVGGPGVTGVAGGGCEALASVRGPKGFASSGR